MFCQNCRNQIMPGQQKCPVCGFAVGQQTSVNQMNYASVNAPNQANYAQNAGANQVNYAPASAPNQANYVQNAGVNRMNYTQGGAPNQMNGVPNGIPSGMPNGVPNGMPNGAPFRGNPAEYMSAKKRGLSKRQFLKQEASSSIRTAAVVFLVLFILSAVLVVANPIVALNEPIYDIPVVSLALNSSGAFNDMSVSLDDLSEKNEDFRDAIEDEKDDLTDEQYEKLIEFSDATDEFAQNLSLSNINAFLDSAQEIIDTEWPEKIENELGKGDIQEEMDVISTVYIWLSVFFYGCAGIILLFVIFAGIFKITWLVIPAILGEIVYGCLFVNPILAIVTIIPLIAMMIFSMRINKAYKSCI